MSNAPAQYIMPEEEGEDICDQIERLAMEAFEEDPGSYPRPSFGWGKGSMHTAVPPQIDINFSGSQFETWQRQWEAFLNGCCNNVHPTKVAAFIKAKLDEAMSKNLQNWIYSQQTLRNAKPSAIIRAIKDRVFDRASVLTIVYRTLLKIQGEREPIEDIIVENNEVIRHFLAVYGRAEEALGVLMLLVRCRTLEIRQKLLQDQDRSYDDLCQLAKNYEAQHLHAANIYNIAATTIHQTHNVDETLYAGQPGRGRGQFRGRGGQRGGRGGNRGGQGGFQKRSGRSTSSSRSKSQTRGCGRCGDENRHPQDQCPAAGKTCKRCQKVGHFSHVCRSTLNNSGSSHRSQSRGRDSTKKTGPNSGQSNTVEEDVSWIGMIELQENEEQNQNLNTLVKEEEETPKAVISPKKRWIEQANAATTPKNVVKADNNVTPLSTINATLADTAGHQVEVEGLPDTGANVNIMPLSIAKKFNVKKGSFKGPKCANGASMNVIGTVTTDVIANDVMVTDVHWRVSDAHRLIMGQSLVKQLGLIPEDFPFIQVNQATAGNEEPSTLEATTTPVEICNDAEINALATKYPEIFCGRVTLMKGKPAKIELSPDAIPTSAGHFRTIADALLEPLKREIDTQMDAGILTKLEEKPDASKYWLHPIVVVPKKGTKDVRLCVDFKKLNKFCLRPTNPQKTPLETVRSLPKGERYFAVFDALKGYHQVPLDEESQMKTAFYTPFGIYAYKSLPMGYAASQDIFTDRFGNAVDSVVQARVTEDCLITATDRPMFLRRIEAFFQKCKEHGIVLGKKKCQIGSEVIFGGFKLDSSGYSLDPALHDAIRKFPPPTTITELRSFMGLINQTTTFTDKIAECVTPLKDLLKKKSDFVWTGEHQEIFEKAREELANVKHLAYFDHRRKTRLYTDASRLNGLGFVLKQLQDDQTWRVVQAGSRFLTSAETRYAMVELELLAIAWACKKAAPFVEGIDFKIFTDHKPLIPILNDYALSDIENKRLQRLKMKLEGLRFEAHHIAGKQNVEADAYSRAPANQPTKEDEIDEEELSAIKTSTEVLEQLNMVTEEDAKDATALRCHAFEANMVDLLAEEIRLAGETDEEYRQLKVWMYGSKHPPPQDVVEPNMEVYVKEWGHLYFDENGLICHDGRVLIPKVLRPRYLEYLVQLHASAGKMKARARKTIWWPFMNKHIDDKARSCPTCIERSPSKRPEPTKPRSPAQYPFQILHADLAQYGGVQFLIVIDQFSGWPTVRRLGRDAPTSKIIEEFMKISEQFGLPETIFSDGGPQFTSKEFEDFVKVLKIDHDTSSPHYPQSNGIAENGVKAMKRLLHCTFDPKAGTVNPEWMKSMLLYRNTPWGPSKLSPAEVLFGRVLRDGIVASKDQYIPKHKAAVEKGIFEVRRYKDNLIAMDLRPGKSFMTGESVVVQDHVTKRWTIKAVIDGPGKNDREYWVKTEAGGRLRRNRRFIRRAATPRLPIITPEDINSTPREPKKLRFDANVKDETNAKEKLPRRSSRKRRPVQRYQAQK